MNEPLSKSESDMLFAFETNMELKCFHTIEYYLENKVEGNSIKLKFCIPYFDLTYGDHER